MNKADEIMARIDAQVEQRIQEDQLTKQDPELMAQWAQAVRLELLEDQARHSEVARAESRRQLAALRAAQERLEMPRVASEPTPIREWAMHRRAQFGPVVPGEALPRYFRAEWMSIALGGQLPTREQVELIAAAVRDEDRGATLLASVALVVLPVARVTSDAEAVRLLIRGMERPVDLETIVNAALVLEFVAAHVQGTVAMGRLVAVAGALWWSAGQRKKAVRSVTIAERFAPTWPVTRQMRDVLQHRGTPGWLRY